MIITGFNFITIIDAYKIENSNNYQPISIFFNFTQTTSKPLLIYCIFFLNPCKHKYIINSWRTYLHLLITNLEHYLSIERNKVNNFLNKWGFSLNITVDTLDRRSDVRIYSKRTSRSYCKKLHKGFSTELRDNKRLTTVKIGIFCNKKSITVISRWRYLQLHVHESKPSFNRSAIDRTEQFQKFARDLTITCSAHQHISSPVILSIL